MTSTLTRRKFIGMGLSLGFGLSTGSCLSLHDYSASQKATVAVIADAYATYPSKSDPGFCLYVEAVRNGQPSGLLFDCGIDGSQLLQTLHRCGISPAAINAVVLSHGYADHAKGSLSILEFLNRFEAKIPVYVSTGVFGDQDLLGRLAQYRVKRIAQKTEVVPGIFATGPLPGTDSGWAGYDDDVDEQAIFLHLNRKGLIVISACSHRGLESAIDTAIRQSGIKQVHAVIGGTHHERAPARIVNETIAHLRSVGLKRVVPMHCASMESIASVRSALPDKFPSYQREGRYQVDSRMVFA
ncbi:MAG: MBL fold metallo-hydrolase [Desulfobacterales bacterium]|mgnify:FL=1|nr:MBL fold metallo-hydrolase [Desulfobacterales bacterium]